MSQSEKDLNRRLHIDRICDEFESLLQQGESPRIEDFLDRVEISERSALAEELAEVEVSVRSSRGEAVSTQEILKRLSQTGDSTLDVTLDLEKETDRLKETAAVKNRTGGRPFPDIEGFEILDVLGRGGMGMVYKARQVALDRIVAIKTIRAGQEAREEDIQRFRIEAEAAARLEHPGIVPVYEIGKYDGQYYFAMGFVDGESLAAKIAERPLPPREGARYLKLVAEAIDYAHQRGVIHRDLKPHNILVDEQGRPKVADFGLAKKVEGDSELTVAGQVLGTPSYMPPEQAEARLGQVSETADIYSLGATLYALITGRPPFQGPSAWDTVAQVIVQEPVAPRKLNAAIPKDLETICLKCLEKDRRKRYQSAQALADELQRFLNGEPIRARPISRTERLGRWCRRNPRVAVPSAAAAVLALALMIGGPTAAVVINGQKQRAQEAERRAEQSEQKAIGQAEVALDALTAIVRAVKDRLQRIPGESSRILRQEITETALARLDRVLEEGGPKSIISAMAWRLRGDTFLESGKYQESLDAYRACLDLVESAPDDPELARRYGATPWLHWQNLARVHDRLGDVYRKLENLDEALEHYETAYRVRSQWMAGGINASQAAQELAVSLGKLGDYYRDKGEMETALKMYLESLGTRREMVDQRASPQTPREKRSLQLAQRELGGALRSVGIIYRKQGEDEKALPYFEEALQYWEDVLAVWKAQPGYDGENTLEANVAILCADIGLTRLLSREYEKAVKPYELAVQHLESLREEDPGSEALRGAYWAALYGLATSQLKRGSEDAGANFRKAREVSRPDSVGQMLSLARCHETEAAAKLAARKAKSYAERNSAEGLYVAATGFALCAWSAKEKSDEQAFDQYATQAIRTLKMAIERGYENVAELKHNPELDALRDLPDFGRMIGDLENRLSAKKDGELPTQD